MIVVTEIESETLVVEAATETEIAETDAEGTEIEEAIGK